MKIKNALLMGLSLVLVAAIAIGGTFAYLTDRDSEANVFTVGDVAIELNEKFEQGATLIPGVDIQKEATITNTGDNDAWVWLTVLLPEEMGPYTAPDNMSASNNVVHWNYPASSAANITVDFNSTPVEVDTDGDGVTESYYQTNMLWNTVLEAGETTGIMLSKVYMDTRVDIDPDGNMYWVVNGDATDLNWNVNEKGNPVIHVSAYAIQAEGFADVEAAYATYNAQWADNGTEYGTSATVVTVSDLDGMKDALASQEPVIVDANDENLGDLDNVAFYDGAVIKNATFTGDASLGSYGNDAYGTVTFINCTFTSDYAYAAHFDGGNGELVFINCTFEGWNSFGTAITGVTFENCTFGHNGYYGLVRVYQDATFTDCTFEADLEGVDSNVTGTVVNFNNCTGISAEKIHNNADTKGVWYIDGVDVSDQITSW